MKKFADFVIRFRILIIILTLMFTVFFSYQLRRLEINSDILSYLPQDDPSVILFNEVGDKFGGNSLAMVALEANDVFSYQTLGRVNEITQEFKTMDEVSQVMSLTDILDIKKTEWGIEVGKLIDKHNIPRSSEELKKLKKYTLSKDMYRGSLVSNNGRVTVIIARLKKGIDKIQIGKRMKKIVRETKGKEKIYYGGIPFQMVSLTDIIMSDLGKLVPLVILLVMVTLYFSFKSFRGIFLPLSSVLISTIWALGIMSLMNIPLTIASNAMPILLIAIGSAYGIHMVSKYNEDIHQGDDKIQGIKDALSEVGVPIFLAGITTLIGFLAFLSSNLSLIREFGVFTAIGVMFAMIISVTFLPAVLSFLHVKQPRPGCKGVENDPLARTMGKLGKFVLRNKKPILGVGITIVLASLVAIPRLHREVNMIDYFKKDSEIRQAEEMMEEKLGGSIPIQLLVKGDLKDPFVLKEMVKLQKYLEVHPEVNDPQSIAYLICEMNRVMNGHYTIPETKEGVANLWFFIEGNEVLDQLINSKATEGLIQAKLGSVNTKKAAILVNKIEDYLKNELKTDLLKVKISLASGELAEELKKERVERILSKIKWDIKRRDAKAQISDTHLRRVIMEAVSTDKIKLDEISIKRIERKINDYFKGGEADVQIKSEDVVTKVVNGVLERLKWGIPSEGEIVAFLKKGIPKSIYTEDPESLKYAAESLMAIIIEERRWTRMDRVIQNLKPLLPKSSSHDRDFQEDLRDDIWEINEDWIALESSKYANLSGDMGSAKERVRLAIQQTGMPIIYTDIDRKIMRSQTLSLSIAIFLVFLLLSFQLKSVIAGLVSISPILLTVLINFILIVILNIPLDVVTVMIGSVAVGIGIDYTIHFTNRFKFELKKRESESEALDKTLRTTGKAIVVNAVSVMMGFLVLVLGSIVPMQRFGFLIAFTMIISALGAITFLPALSIVTKVGFTGNFRHSKACVSNENYKG